VVLLVRLQTSPFFALQKTEKSRCRNKVSTAGLSVLLEKQNDSSAITSEETFSNKRLLRIDNVKN